MNFYDSIENVEKYLEIADGFDGRDLFEVLKGYLAEGSSLLELGMGPGKDLEIFSEAYKVTGSDRSDIFLERFRERKETADLLKLDAVTIKTDRRFDCIYSNKVLMHLTVEQLRESLKRQYDVLNQGGLVFHSFWFGSGTDEFDGLFFQYYDEMVLKEIFEVQFKIVVIQQYQEDEEGDSVYVIAKKHPRSFDS